MEFTSSELKLNFALGIWNRSRNWRGISFIGIGIVIELLKLNSTELSAAVELDPNAVAGRESV